MLINTLIKSLTQLSHTPPSQVWVAYSGGVDSHVLLHALQQLSPSFPWLKLMVIHVDHGLHPEAKQWSQHCQKICDELQLHCRITTIKLNPQTAQSLEEAARDARYQVFKDNMGKGDYVFTAHHQDDQAETLLLQLLRGAGVKGLAAMPISKKFAQGFIYRPLLKVPRETILSYAKQHQLQWINDDSNYNQRFSRNFLRHQIIPELKKYWPAINQNLTRSAQHCAQASELLEELARVDLTNLTGSVTNTLSASQLQNLPIARQKNALRGWILNQGFRLPSTAKLAQICQSVINARYDALPCITWNNTQIRRYADNIFIMSSLVLHSAKQQFSWNLTTPLVIQNIGILSAQAAIGEGLKLTGNVVSVRFRQGGEVCRLAGRTGTRHLKQLFQEWKVPPWQRDRIPLIYVNEKLAMIVGLAICEGYIARAGEKGIKIEIINSPSPD